MESFKKVRAIIFWSRFKFSFSFFLSFLPSYLPSLFKLHAHRPLAWQWLWILPAAGTLCDLSSPCLQLTHTCTLKGPEGRDVDQQQKAGGCICISCPRQCCFPSSHFHYTPTPQLLLRVLSPNIQWSISCTLVNRPAKSSMCPLSPDVPEVCTGSEVGGPECDVSGYPFSSQVPQEILFRTLTHFPYYRAVLIQMRQRIGSSGPVWATEGDLLS